MITLKDLIKYLGVELLGSEKAEFYYKGIKLILKGESENKALCYSHHDGKDILIDLGNAVEFPIREHKKEKEKTYYPCLLDINGVRNVQYFETPQEVAIQHRFFKIVKWKPDGYKPVTVKSRTDDGLHGVEE